MGFCTLREVPKTYTRCRHVQILSVIKVATWGSRVLI